MKSMLGNARQSGSTTVCQQLSKLWRQETRDGSKKLVTKTGAVSAVCKFPGFIKSDSGISSTNAEGNEARQIQQMFFLTTERRVHVKFCSAVETLTPMGQMFSV